MALALYRRYRPDTLDGVIGQPQVTVPLARALDNNRITQAYLFSGPRGTGKTSTARILARCLNCEKGPTSHPCGKCASCRDLATGGPGSVDVVEIDAASHNGVEDARQIRERAQFAPTRDRYKIFILDEAHMVTPQGFNALLKIVEEPPEHVIFIFATTEPDKVISTIRSRTHHYPFRLVPPEILGPYVSSVCKDEKISLDKGVLSLVLRAGGGSVRDTLSVLDQLMVGAKEGKVELSAATNLLGYTPVEMISGTIDALVARDGSKLYDTVEKVAIGGFEPRRFVQDLLGRLRDLVMISLAGTDALKSTGEQEQADNAESLKKQADALGLPVLNRLADAADSALSAMAAATSPRMKLELLAARLLEIVNEAHQPRSAASRLAAARPAASRPLESRPAPTQPVRPAPAAPAPRARFAQPQQAQAPVQARPVSTLAAQPAAQNRPAAPAARPPQDPQAAWKQVLASLDDDVRVYVASPRVDHVDFMRNRAGGPHLVFTFDKPVSQHAFAMAVTRDRKKVTLVVLSAVRQVFGPQASIAPATHAANGEVVRTMRSMTPQEQAKVKQQIALLAATAAMGGSSIGTAASMASGSGAKAAAEKPAASASPSQQKSFASSEHAQAEHAQTERAEHASMATGGPGVVDSGSDSEGSESSEGPDESGDSDDSDHHRAAGSSANVAAGGASGTSPALASDGFAVPNVRQEREEAALDEAHEHHKKHIAVPDPRDTADPWAMPAKAAQTARSAAATHPAVRPARPAQSAISSVPPASMPQAAAAQPTPARQAYPVQSPRAAAPAPVRSSVPLAGKGPRPVSEGSSQALQALQPGQPVSVDQLAEIFEAKKVTSTGKKKAEEDVRQHAEIHLGKGAKK